MVILMTNVCEKKKGGNEGSRSPYDGVLGDFLDGRIIADILIAGDKGVKEVWRSPQGKIMSVRSVRRRSVLTKGGETGWMWDTVLPILGADIGTS